ncbi:MAG: DUF1800 family protein [Steroidobacteraceae bacterium]
MRRGAIASLLGAWLLVACGGGGGGTGGGGGQTGGGAPAPTITRGEAATFLRQASFGPNRAEIDRVVASGYAAWIDQQFAQPASLQAPALRALGRAPTQDDRLDQWFRHAVQGPDQLRLRAGCSRVADTRRLGAQRSDSSRSRS